MSDSVEFTDYDTDRPAKKVKLEASLSSTMATDEEVLDGDEGWDDIYGSNNTNKSSRNVDTTPAPLDATAEEGTLLVVPPSSSHQTKNNTKKEEEAVIERGDILTDEVPYVLDGSGHASQAVLNQTTTISGMKQGDEDLDLSTMPSEDHETVSRQVPADATSVEVGDVADINKQESSAAAQAAQHTNPPEQAQDAPGDDTAQDAEFRFDSSDLDSDSSDSSSDDSSNEDSDEEYALLDPATAARILMAGDGDDEDGDKQGKSSAGHAPRSTNEVKENAAPRPQIEITPQMQITMLGKIEGIVENSILIRGHTSGEYQVLEPGSVLCTEDRKVIGAVADLFGRVQEPMYSVMLDESHEELVAELGLASSVEVFYVNDHSKFVFTEPLRGMKGTDASNIHDEEVGEDELEFSDDEQEAEYKRQRKLAKKAGRGNFSRGDFESGERIATNPRTPSGPPMGTHRTRNDMPRLAYEGALDYDGEGPSDGFYNPLKRPDNLSQLMAGTAPRASFDRGRGRGRGRGDRGRGRGNQRGGHDRGRGSHHNAQSSSQPSTSHALDRAPAASVPLTAYLPQQTQPMQPQPQQTYQFNGYNFQYGSGVMQAPQPQQSQAYYSNPQPVAPAHPGYYSAAPAGTHIDPSYYAALQAQQYAASQTAPTAYPQQYGQPAYAFNPQAPGTASQPDLAEIMRRLGHNAQS